MHAIATSTVLAALLLSASAALSAPISTRVGLIVENTDGSADGCRIATASVRETATRGLRDAGWSIDEQPTDFLYVNVNVVPQQKTSSCAFNISIAVARRLLTGYGGHVLGVTASKSALGTPGERFCLARLYCSG